MAKAGRNGDPAAGARQGLLRDALADWTNDDILQTEAARAALGARHPAGLRVLDWPELRAAFAAYDTPATRHGQRDRRLGLLSVGLATLGLVLAVASPLAIGAERAIGIMALGLVVAGLGIMVFHRLGTRSKARALGYRFGAERVRALYFQALANNLELASRAMADDAALDNWRTARAEMLSHLPDPETQPDPIPDLAAPVGDAAGTWVSPDWSTAPAPPTPSDDLDLLLSLLRGQRLDGQIDYVQRKLSASLGAPGQRAAAVRIMSLLLVAAAVVTGLIAVVLVATGRGLGDTDLKLALEVTVGAIVAVVALGMTNDGRLLVGDARRYAAYLATLTQARVRFRTGGLAEKVAALREVEVVCYRDLRDFVTARGGRAGGAGPAPAGGS